MTGSAGDQPFAGRNQLDRDGFDLVFTDGFDGGRLDPARWVDHYLPHWTTAERSAAHYVLEGDGVRLLVEVDQPAWRTQDGPMRVSNLQTGSFSGPRGSSVGQHRHRQDLRVISPQPTRRLWTPSSGLVEARLRGSADPTCMLAIWLIGFEEASPQQSGEICIAELYGDAIGPRRSRVRMGIKAHHDPHLRTDMADFLLDLDATEEHTYAAEFDARGVRFFVDDTLVRIIDQPLNYPLQLMVDLFEFPVGDDRESDRYPKSATVRAVRGYRRAARQGPG